MTGPSKKQLEFIHRTIVLEGGYVDHPNDKGGPTNSGITQSTLSRYLGRPATKDDVKQLAEGTAVNIYYKNYLLSPGIDLLPEWAQGHAFDCCVLHGTGGAVVMIQKAVGAATDGKIGPQTVKAVSAMVPLQFHANLLQQRLEKFAAIVQNNSSQRIFLLGWIRRAMQSYKENVT